MRPDRGQLPEERHSHEVSAADLAFAADFEAGRVVPADFDHRAHVRLAYIYLCRGDAAQANARMRGALRGFLERNGIDRSKFHETLTAAWILAVQHFMQRSSGAPDADAFIDVNPALLDPRIMLTHYSAEVLFSAQARAAFVEPDLQDIPRYEASEPRAMHGMAFSVERALEILERTPAVFRAMLDGLSAEWTRRNEGGDTFSAWDNIAHLVHGERNDWIGRAQLILARGDERRSSPFDRYAHRSQSQGRTIRELLDEFQELRSTNLATLRNWNLTDDALELTGEHPTFGNVTLRQLLATWVAHDLGHIAQTARVLAKQYGEEVGPWREFLPVLTR